MPVGKCESPDERVEVGLRILARIIAREAVHDRRGNVESTNVARYSWDGIGAMIIEGGMDENITMEEVA